MLKKILLTTAFAATLGLISPVSADVITNGGFEAGTGTNADAWEEIAAGPNGTVIRDESDFNSGSASAYMSFDNTGDASPGNYLIQQVGAVGTIDPNENYELVFSAKADSTDFTGINFFVQLQFLDQDGSNGGGVVGNTLLSLISDSATLGNSISTSYQTFTLADIDAPTGADSYQLSFQVPAGAVADIGNGMHVDDVSLSIVTAVPEPGTATVLSLMLVGGFLRRRR